MEFKVSDIIWFTIKGLACWFSHINCLQMTKYFPHIHIHTSTAFLTDLILIWCRIYEQRLNFSRWWKAASLLIFLQCKIESPLFFRQNHALMLKRQISYAWSSAPKTPTLWIRTILHSCMAVGVLKIILLLLKYSYPLFCKSFLKIQQYSLLFFFVVIPQHCKPEFLTVVSPQ